MAVDERDIATLQRRLDDAYRSLREHDKAYSDAIQKCKRDFQTLREDLVKSTKTLQKDLIGKFRTAEEDLRKNYALQIAELQEGYNRKLQAVQELEAKFRCMIEELDAEQRKVIAEMDRKKARAYEVAKEQEANFNSAVNAAALQPTEIFYPHRLHNYAMAGEKARALMEEGMYTLSANDYSNLTLAVNELTENTVQKLREVQAMFEIYRTLAARIDLQRTSPYVLYGDDGEAVLALDDDNDMDYWSDSLFYTLSQIIDTHKRNAGAGPDVWLASHRDAGISPVLLLDREIRSLENIPEQLKICITYALSACDSYNFLFDIRDIVSQALSEQNYVYEGTLFGRRNNTVPDSPGYQHYRRWLDGETCIAEGSEPDYREERCMCFRSPEGNICRVYMVPVRTNGTVAFNLWLESLAEHNPEKVQYALQNILASRLQMPVNISDNQASFHSSVSRVMTETELRQLAGVRDRDTLTAKYCIGGI